MKTSRRVLLTFACAACAPVSLMAEELPFAGGLVYHLDAGAGLTLSGAAVTGWADQSGNSNNFLQADALKQPTFVSSAINGSPAVRFDGNLAGAAGGVAPNADELLLTTSTTVQTFVTVNRLAFANTGLAGIWGGENSDVGIRRASNTAWQGSTTSAGNGNDFSFGGSMLINGSTTGTVAEGVPHIMVATSTNTKTFGTTSLGDYFQSGAVTPRSYAGDVAEVLVFDRQLTTIEQKQLSVHLGAKYDIAGGSGIVFNVGGKNAVGSESVGGVDARYVVIHTDGTSSGGGDANANAMHIGEIEVFAGASSNASGLDSSRNYALNTKGSTFTTVAGTGGHGADVNVINGTLDTGGNTWTRVGPNPQGGVVEGIIDLGSNRLVGSVRVWQRADCCPERLRNFTITVEDGSHTPLQTFTFPGMVTAGSYANFDLTDVVTSFSLGSSDILSIDLNATANQGDKLLVGSTGNGALTLVAGASLNVANLSGMFTPGQIFDLLDFGSLTGTFETINLPGGASQWDLSSLYSTGQITYVPEPASVLVLLGSCGMMLRRRRASLK